MAVFGTIRNFRERRTNNVSKACIVSVFETIWNRREKMKTRMVNGAL